MDKKPEQKLTTDDFINDPRVLKSIADLDGLKNKIYSDVLDEEGNQYVNLVQKGGGVLGVALVGYTYILEKAGLRFLRLAGTSAGAINTAFMASIGGKTEEKSKTILQIMCDLDFFKLVDGHPAARRLIKMFITNEDFTSKAKTWLLGIVGVFLLLIASNITFLGLEHAYPALHYVTILSFVLTGFYFVVLGVLVFYVLNLLHRLKNAGFGINPGDYFYDWLKDNLKNYGVENVSELKDKVEQKVPGMRIRETRTDKIDDLKGTVTFIASELVTQNKIEFPLMCDLFRSGNDMNEMKVAGFIRASMSIPIFFESYFINDIPCTDTDIKKAWKDRFQMDDPPSSSRFVDGGMLSNFPINIFYDPSIIIPRIPSFGIDLDDSTREDNSKNSAYWSLGGYLGRMFNTIRYYYDKDFLQKNTIFEKGIGKIPLAKFNWLNFFMKDEEKIEMFAIGAKAAVEFLKGFDWVEYKNSREQLKKDLDDASKPKQ